MTIEIFATQYRLRLRHDSCGDLIAGKPPRPRPEDCSHIFETGTPQLGLCLLLGNKRRWNNAKKRLLADGFILKQDGDTEGVLLFDPTNAAQAALAIKESGIRPMQNISPEVRALRQTMVAKARGALGPSL